MSAILIESLTRRYGPRRGVEGVNLAVGEGSLFGFLGPNGAGKTTTIRVLLGFLRATSGQARILGLDCWARSKQVKREVGSIPGDLRLYSRLSGHETVRLAGRIGQRDLAARARELAAAFDLDLSVRVRQMSRGMRQKLGLVLALAPRPQVLVLDEPSSGLDPLMQEVLRDQLRAMARSGHTVFFSSHTLAEVEALCDRVAIVREGRVIIDEPLDQLRRRAGHEVVARLTPAARTMSLSTPPEFQQPIHSEGTLSGTWRGPAAGLIAWLHTLPVEDVRITPPSLESLFRGFYGGDSP
jgi:ABC-2 type transport system ATP-binding protein